MSADAARHLPSPPQRPAGLSLSAVTGEPAPALLYTIAEAATLLHVPEGWLRKKVTAGSVPHTRLGKHVRFTVDHLHRIVVSGEVEPAPTPPGVGQGVSLRARRRPGPVA
ncbi:MAG: helix-turn-helix domain-containing protein [Trebonia sp.]